LKDGRRDTESAAPRNNIKTKDMPPELKKNIGFVKMFEKL